MRTKAGRARNRRLKGPFFKRVGRFLAGHSKILFLLSALPIAGLAAFLIYRGVATADFLAIKAVNVHGTGRLAKDEIIEATGIKSGQNIFSFSSRAVEENLKENPWVRTASVSRRLPAAVEIEITEREPVALVKMDELFLMDSSGVIFKKAERADALDLPVITGLNVDVLREGSPQDGLLELLGVLRERAGFGVRSVSEVHIDPVYGLSVYTLDDGVRLMLGTGGFEDKLRIFEKVSAARGGVLKGIETMDLTREKEAIVRFKSNVAKEGGAI